jgi:demethylsterigmatocystin 6-O-methyltransferase
VDGTYIANHTTCWLAEPSAEGGVKHYLKTISPCFQALPEVLKRDDYRNPSVSTTTAFNAAHKTDLPLYQWRPSDPALGTAFLAFMKGQRAEQKHWTDTFPFALLEMPDKDRARSRVLFVDVGGAGGHQCVALRDVMGKDAGVMVLQDQEEVIDRAEQSSLRQLGVEPVAHDFFLEQPVKGAKAYYLRNVLHDWPDEQCKIILTKLKDACEADSMVLMDEMVVPDHGCPWQQAQKDLQMMATHAAMERSKSQWEDIVGAAGLKIDSVITYDDAMGDSVIVAKVV